MSIKDLIKSFKSSPGGYSGRKLSAFWSVVVIATYLSYKYTDTTNVDTMVSIWLLFASLCMGLVTIQNIIELKNGNNDNNTATNNEVRSAN